MSSLCNVLCRGIALLASGLARSHLIVSDADPPHCFCIAVISRALVCASCIASPWHARVVLFLGLHRKVLHSLTATDSFPSFFFKRRTRMEQTGLTHNVSSSQWHQHETRWWQTSFSMMPRCRKLVFSLFGPPWRFFFFLMHIHCFLNTLLSFEAFKLLHCPPPFFFACWWWV